MMSVRRQKRMKTNMIGKIILTSLISIFLPTICYAHSPDAYIFYFILLPFFGITILFLTTILIFNITFYLRFNTNRARYLNKKIGKRLFRIKILTIAIALLGSVNLIKWYEIDPFTAICCFVLICSITATNLAIIYKTEQKSKMWDAAELKLK